MGRQIGRWALSLILLCAGSLLTAIAVNGILLPRGFLSGGFTGLALLIHYLAPVWSVSLLYLLLNLPLYVMGWRFVGRRFFAWSVAGALILAAALHRRLTWVRTRQSLMETMHLTVMIFWIIIGANAFTHFLAYAGIQDMVQKWILSLDVGRWTILLTIQFIYFLLGCFLDPAGILLLTTPIFVPVISQLGFDPLWFGILFVVNMEMAYITPPFGFNLFILKGVSPPDVTMTDIYNSVWPYVICQALCLAVCMLAPEMTTWLPSLMVAR